MVNNSHSDRSYGWSFWFCYCCSCRKSLFEITRINFCAACSKYREILSFPSFKSLVESHLAFNITSSYITTFMWIKNCIECKRHCETLQKYYTSLALCVLLDRFAPRFVLRSMFSALLKRLSKVCFFIPVVLDSKKVLAKRYEGEKRRKFIVTKQILVNSL